MKLKEFVSMFDLKEYTIETIKYVDSSFYLTILIDINISYMANGCRPEFDSVSKHLFIFKDQDFINDYDEIQFVKNLKYENNKLILSLSNIELIIKDCDVEIKQNIM